MSLDTSRAGISHLTLGPAGTGGIPP
jgi:hypothetical protein